MNSANCKEHFDRSYVPFWILKSSVTILNGGVTNSRVELGQNWNYLSEPLKPIFYYNIGHVLSLREFKGDLGDFLHF